MSPTFSSIIHKKNFINSTNLNREVRVDIFLPQNYLNFSSLPTLFLHDGQDYQQLGLTDTLQKHNEIYPDKPLAIIALWANENRLNEYGTIDRPDYKGRGILATQHAKFLRSEVIPLFKTTYPQLIQSKSTYIAGFSLGGLSAFDLAWEYPHLFAKVGVFSGSFWWRSKAYEDGYEDHDRIMHQKVAEHRTVTNETKFWLQCGTKDEESDRNNSGIIDSIEDTLDLIMALKKRGYKDGTDISYHEVPGGEHNFATWKRVFPEFLQWLYT